VKLYKFRPLASDTDFNRLKEILETRKFHCSKFSELNDPMEGVYLFSNDTEDRAHLIDLIFKAKESYKICSFSNEEAFSNPIMWGYYANGFRGVAVEIEVSEEKVKKINYVDKIPKFAGANPDENAVEILTTKLSLWTHEGEYRFLKNIPEDKFEIGNITALYFGDPYENVINKPDITESSNAIRTYSELKKEISSIADRKKTKVHRVKLDVHSVTKENYKVIKCPLINDRDSMNEA